MPWSWCTVCLVSCQSVSLCRHNHILHVRCCSLRNKLARALALLRTYQSRLRAAQASAAAAPPPEALGAARVPPVGAAPALPAPGAARGEVRSGPAGQCPACCQRAAGVPGRGGADGGAADRVRVDADPAVAPAPPDALADLAASLLAWQLRRGGATLEGLGSASRGPGSAPQPAAASTSAAPQNEAGRSSGGRALRFDPCSGRSGAFVYEAAGGHTGSREPGMPADAACAPAGAYKPLAGSGPGQYSSGGSASWDPSARQAAGPAAPASANAGALDAPHGSGTGVAAANRHGDSYVQGTRSAVGFGAGGGVQRWACGSAAGPLADRAPAAAAAGLAVAHQHPGPGVEVFSAVDELVPWRQRAPSAHAHEGPEAADRAGAVRMQPGEPPKMSAPAR